jgi:RHS repeat-associated protein
LRAGQVKLARVSPGAFRHSQSASVSYYSGDNRLMAMQRYDASVPKDGHPDPITGRGTWEEYRYDALGRRVVTIVRRGLLALCSPQISPECDSYVERVVWDGDDLLYEHREGGSQYTGGSVGYVQGGVIDQPLAQLNGRILNPNWRGLYESSVLPNGTRGDCSLPGSGACTTVSWPAGQGVYYIRFPVSGGANTPTWIGSLASNGEGSTGLLYRRNRFYDPATGQFTQQDPIGLAGGLNQYGYANGDPVNFSDPFGLCPPADDNLYDCPTREEMSWYERLFEGQQFIEADGKREQLIRSQMPDFIGGVGRGVSLFRGARSVLRNIFRTSWIQGISGGQGLAVLRHLKAGAMDEVSLAMEEGGTLVMTARKMLDGGGRIDTVRRIGTDGKQLSASRQVYDASGELIKEAPRCFEWMARCE